MAATSSPDASDRFPEVLRVLDDSVLAEVVREGEQLVDAQFAAAQAADQRALTLGGAAMTLAGAGIGFLLSGMPKAVGIPQTALAVVIGATVLALVLTATLAIFAAMPRPFLFPGNEPANWHPEHWGEVEGRKFSLRKARLEQAAVLQAKISANRRVAHYQARLVRAAVQIGFISVGSAIIVLLSTYVAIKLQN